ncbi:MAG: lysostaphin resistance A-like protein [Agrococcus casei]|uniref:CPBP family intramembrane glutamic endopeptidase n=1 Tax=Agrococcus casei TaxID=343512 RepID=UPI003F96B8B8
MTEQSTIPRSSAPEQTSARTPRWAIGLPVLRVVLVAAASGLTWVSVSVFDGGVSFPPPPMLAVLAMVPVNLICFWLVRRLLHRQGRTIRELLGFEPRRLLRDLLWGLLWIAVLYLPFTGAILLVTWLQHGSELFEQMETIFFDPASIPTLSPAAWLVIAIIGVLTFAPLNAPVEELVYRGYAQGTLARRWPAVLAIVVPSLVFAIQHIWYAPTPDAVVAYVVAFFVWGVGSGLIYLRQRRLMPLVFTHGLVNLFFSLPALAVPFIPAELMTNGA